MNETEKLPLSAFMPHHPSSNPNAPFTATAGKKNKDFKKKIELSQVIKALETIFDPEIPVNIYELGLIYDVKISEDNDVMIEMTLTSPNCPVAESLPLEVEEKVKTMGCEKHSKKGCNGKSAKCITHNLWDELEDYINIFFQKKKIK